MYKFNFKKLLIFLIVSNFVLLLIYEVFLKENILKAIQLKDDPLDINYYSKIFSNLTCAVILTTILLFLFYFFKNKISSIIDIFIQRKRELIYLVIINSVLQIIILLSIRTVPISDSKYYIEHAQKLWETGSYLNSYQNKTSFWPVGLPFLIYSLHFISNNYLLLLKLVNVIFSNILIVLLYKYFSKNLNQKELIIFMLAFILFPNNLFSVNLIMTELPYTMLFWFSIYLFTKENLKYKFPIVGMIIGLMTYLKTFAFVLPVVFILTTIDWGKPFKSFKNLSIIYVFTFIILSPWIIRNYLVFDSFVLNSTNGGFNFLMGNHANATGGVNFDFNYDISNPNEVEEEKNAYMNGIKAIKDDPMKFILRLPKKLFFSYFRGDSSITWALKNTNNHISGIFLSLIFYLNNFIFYLVIFLSIISFIKNNLMLSEHKILIYSYLCIIGIIAIFVGSERYIIPFIPLHFLFAVKLFTHSIDA